ncbi:acyl-CoA N-acyltransferase [Exophiala viscosa]|uniref:acyl-CoA N-acyltransferase n=1 Tax=Exophiala viscosa TaxID=2486360 RepID=UPI0021A08B9D|nr:acyl-CoA N-acyltransferase [Exophiala viscosa]
MPVFVVLPASSSDLEAIVRVQFDACANDHGFPVIFPKGPTRASVTHFVRAFEHDMENDPTCQIVIAKHSSSGEVASYAIWNFFPSRTQEEIEEEMLIDEYPLPRDANKQLGNALIHNSIRKRHEVVAANIGERSPYAYLAAVGTSPKYQNQGAASKLLTWGLERADDRGLATYVEGAPAGFRLYEKFGFKEVAKLRLDLAPWSEGDHFNICMVRKAASEDA